MTLTVYKLGITMSSLSSSASIWRLEMTDWSFLLITCAIEKRPKLTVSCYWKVKTVSQETVCRKLFCWLHLISRLLDLYQVYAHTQRVESGPRAKIVFVQLYFRILIKHNSRYISHSPCYPWAQGGETRTSRDYMAIASCWWSRSYCSILFTSYTRLLGSQWQTYTCVKYLVSMKNIMATCL